MEYHHPLNARDWQPDVAVLPSATIDGERVTLHNVRNFIYRSATDFTPQYYDKTVDLRQLETVDLIASYWAGDAIAHLMVSFGFGETDYVAVSIETRKERLEDYSSLKGFFKQYELIYVVADERDVIRLRIRIGSRPRTCICIVSVARQHRHGVSFWIMYGASMRWQRMRRSTTPSLPTARQPFWSMPRHLGGKPATTGRFC